jgi:cell filamentation protein
MSKYLHDNNPIYIDGTEIPKNKLGITDAVLLHEVEAQLLKDAYAVFLDELSGKTIFDEAYFKSLHRRTFESLYEWAGEYRNLNMAKGESRFCQAAYLQNESERIFGQLAKEGYLRGTAASSREEFAERLAWYKCELIALHPFVELNGRITRLFFDMIAVANGYELIDYTQAATGKKTNDYIQASIDCVRLADCKKMYAIILNGLRRHDSQENTP